ncbi:hypothetical protein [Streptomyces sp. NEAU-NA10]|uniref:hypothetical protein n=1 Tax=Streptomyces sp. NEAU-NA10 TaxID=3416050 RepID=UPI003CC5B3B4
MRRLKNAAAVTLVGSAVLFASLKTAYAHTGDAEAQGGDGVAVQQQDTAQNAKQVNHCEQPLESADLTTMFPELNRHDQATTTGCGNADLSKNRGGLSSRNGDASAQGGDAAAGDLFQQNTAQSAQQANACANPVEVLSGEATSDSEREAQCRNFDASRSEGAASRTSTAHAQGGDSATGDLIQQNTAQSAKQANACASPVNSVNATFEDFSSSSDVHADTSCRNADVSHNGRGSSTDAGAVTAEGGDRQFGVIQQNNAQSAKQANACADRQESVGTRSRIDQEASASCLNADASRNGKGSSVSSGGATAQGGDGASHQQNTAQSGKQANACANPQELFSPAIAAQKFSSTCVNADASRNGKGSSVSAGGATAHGGDGVLLQQNTAQSGKQLNSCENPHQNVRSSPFTGSFVDRERSSRCVNADDSHNGKGSSFTSGGAAAEGGGGSVGDAQQNTAQSGRQANACANPLRGPVLESRIDETSDASCVNKDGSRNGAGSSTSTGHAQVEGGDATGDLTQQNTAQSAKQANACAGPSQTLTDSEVTDQTRTSCVNADFSRNGKKTSFTTGDAKVVGGDAAGDLFQQNTAQSGKQLNSCGNSSEFLDSVGSSRDSSVQCGNLDLSENDGPGHHHHGYEEPGSDKGRHEDRRARP